jgi:hypothetical protein
LELVDLYIGALPLLIFLLPSSARSSIVEVPQNVFEKGSLDAMAQTS